MKCPPSRGEGSQNALRSAAPAQLHPHNFSFNIFFHNMKNGFFVFGLENSAKKPEKTKAPEPGHGLGLKIIRQIVERCDGLLEMEQGEDSYRVTLALPLG